MASMGLSKIMWLSTGLKEIQLLAEFPLWD